MLAARWCHHRFAFRAFLTGSWGARRVRLQVPDDRWAWSNLSGIRDHEKPGRIAHRIGGGNRRSAVFPNFASSGFAPRRGQDYYSFNRLPAVPDVPS